VGTNTDMPALVDAVRSLRPRPRHAVVLGAGGAGRAAVRAVERAGAESVSIAARRAAHGALPWSCLPALLPDADLLVNATPVGTGIDESPVPASLLHPGLAVLDLVYRPSPTRLVRDARVLGAPAQAGASVLLGQGWRSLELWLGVPAPRAVMAHALRRELGEGADV
jgi:shikimate dehydrogenase